MMRNVWEASLTFLELPLYVYWEGLLVQRKQATEEWTNVGVGEVALEIPTLQYRTGLVKDVPPQVNKLPYISGSTWEPGQLNLWLENQAEGNRCVLLHVKSTSKQN